MIVHLFGGKAQKAFYPEDEDGLTLEPAVIITRDADDNLVLQQRNESVCISKSCASEFVKALQLHAKEFDR